MEVIHPRCAGLDVHKQTVVACARIVGNGPPVQEVRTFATEEVLVSLAAVIRIAAKAIDIFGHQPCFLSFIIIALALHRVWRCPISR